MSKKLPHQISLEDLLEALEHTTDEVQELVSYRNDIPMFLSKFKIEAGENYIRAPLLYKLYKIFSKDPVTQHTFSNSVADFVPRDKKYFKLNLSPIKLTKILNPQTKYNYTSSLSVKKHYEAFINNCSIVKGVKWIEGFLLFEVYRFYCIDAKRAKRLRYAHFISISEMYFESKRIGSSKGRYFKLDPEILNILPMEHQEKVRNDRKMSEKEKLKRKPKK